MSTRRAPSAPPRIDGFEHLSLLGTGGFADVFLYEQQRPRRRVAVKVLLAELMDSGARERFDSEADRMAQLSSHPSIVTIYEAGIASDGRPYLAMEYCPRPNLGAIYRREPLGVAEALRIGIQVAGAVETAHRAGILHRDIKPANILVTEYNRPALTDFGIAATTEGAHTDAEGMSIPWSPPESFAEPPRSGVGTDVWALAATIHTLLSGRSPFEVPGGANTGADLISRIERSPLQPTGRTDVPAALERVLATAMAKRPEGRYPTALALARALQRVQTELQLAVTPVDVLDDAPPAPVLDAPDDDDEPATRIRQVVTIHPTAPSPAREVPVELAPLRPRDATVNADVDDRTVFRGGASGRRRAVPRPESAPVQGVPTQRSAAGGGPAGEDGGAAQESGDLGADERVGSQRTAPTGRRRLAVLGGAALGLTLVVVVVLAMGGGGADPAPTPSVPTAAEPVDPVGTVVPAPTDLVGAAQGAEVVFTWKNPDPAPGDTYLWRAVSALEESTYREVTAPTATTPAGKDATCVEVVIRRAGRTSQIPTRACAP